MHQSIQWTDAVVQSIRDITPTVREFTLRPAGVPVPYAAGAHLQVELWLQGRVQTRSYSLVGLADGVDYRIAVKRLDAGRGGSRAMWQLAEGDRLRVSAPQNHFTLELQAPAYLLVAGGIGVTPLVAMAQTLVQRGARVHMLLAARSDSELAYADTLHALLGDALTTRVSDHGQRADFSAAIAQLPPGGLLVCCGPVSMLEAARQAWEQAGRPAQDLRFETFGSSGHLAAQAFRVQVPRQQVDITVPEGSSLLDAIEMAGVQALSDCRRGECGLCAMEVLAVDGQIDHRDVFLSAHEKQQNRRICVCVSRVVGAITLDCAYRPDALGVPA